jgi:hypothetical protein
MAAGKPGTPDAPILDPDVIPTKDSVAVMWTEPDDDGADPIIGYYLYYSLTNDEDSYELLVDSTDVANLEYVHDTTSVADGYIYYKVAAYNSLSTSEISDSLEVLSASAPNEPTDVEALYVAVDEEDQGDS